VDVNRLGGQSVIGTGAMSMAAPSGVRPAANTSPARVQLIVHVPDAGDRVRGPHRVRALDRALDGPSQDDVATVEALDGDLVVVDTGSAASACKSWLASMRSDAGLVHVVAHQRPSPIVVIEAWLSCRIVSAIASQAIPVTSPTHQYP
jgi:hypothetical protein